METTISSILDLSTQGAAELFPDLRDAQALRLQRSLTSSLVESLDDGDLEVAFTAVTAYQRGLLAALGGHAVPGRPMAEDAVPFPVAGLPPGQGEALGNVWTSFRAFEAAAREMVAGADGQAGVAHLLAARAGLLEAALELRDVVGGPAPSFGAAVDLCPAFAVDTAGLDSTYSADCALIVDVGGNDRYLNNAGGGGTWSWECRSIEPLVASAVIDLGGNDAYGDASSPRSCGANGGAAEGAGFLVDLGDGEDRYVAGDLGVNGGSSGLLAMGLLIDEGGDDEYVADDDGANGGGYSDIELLTVGGVGTFFVSQANFGLLIDGAGSDRYLGGDQGTNGGGFWASGTLLDLGSGDDVYTGANCHSLAEGERFHKYTGATYPAVCDNSFGSNGGGWLGPGLLVDQGGNDDYTAGGWSVNGGGPRGTLIDLGPGNDVHTAHGFGVNGGGGGLLFDQGGVDAYESAYRHAVNGGDGLLWDNGGTGDQYREWGGCWTNTDATFLEKGVFPPGSTLVSCTMTGAFGAQIDR